MKFFSIILAAVVLSLSASAVSQSKYSVSITRKDSNLYKVDNKEIWVQTRYCYEYAYYEDAVLSSSQIVFVDNETTCDVKRVLQEAKINSGSYELSVTHEDDELYSTLDGFYIRTSMCLELGISEDALLRVNSYGGGTLVFLDNGRKCDVESVLRPMQL